MADIGSTLRDARMRARIDISEVEAQTKIRAKYLRAMENEEWDLLPGPVYVKSFLRTYSGFLGLDSRALTDEYKRRYERPPDQDLRPMSPVGRERDRRRRTPRLGPVGAVVFVLAAVVAALFLVGSLGDNGSNPSATSSVHRATVAGRASGKHHRRHPPAHKPTNVTLQLVPTSQVYVCLEDGSGKRLIPGVVFAPGQSIPTKTAKKLMLTLGNAGVHMKVNGKKLAVAPSARAIGYVLTPGKAAPLPPSRQPTCA